MQGLPPGSCRNDGDNTGCFIAELAWYSFIYYLDTSRLNHIIYCFGQFLYVGLVTMSYTLCTVILNISSLYVNLFACRKTCIAASFLCCWHLCRLLLCPPGVLVTWLSLCQPGCFNTPLSELSAFARLFPVCVFAVACITCLGTAPVSSPSPLSLGFSGSSGIPFKAKTPPWEREYRETRLARVLLV